MWFCQSIVLKTELLCLCQSLGRDPVRGNEIVIQILSVCHPVEPVVLFHCVFQFANHTYHQ